MKFLRSVVVGTLLAMTTALHAGNPTNPILFVTQVPIPEEVNSRDVTQSFMSIASPFSNHLADTLHAGRGGSLWVRFNNGQLINLLAVADWNAIPGGQPAADAMAVRNPAVNWTATKAIFSMTTGKPTGPTDTTQFLFQLYEITLPTQAQLTAAVPMKPVLTKVANQPAYNNVFPTYAQSGKIVFSSDRPYNGQAHLAQREEYLSLPTVSGLWVLDPTDATSLKILHHAPSGAFYPFVDSAGRVIFTNWDHLSRDTQAVTDSRPPDPTYSETFTQTINGSGNFVDETAAAAFTAVTAMGANTWDVFPEPRNFDRKTLHDFFPVGATGSYLNGNAFNLFLPWMISLDGTGGELLNHVGRHEVGTGFTRSFNTDANLMDFNPSTAPSATNGNYAIHNFFTSFFAPREDPLNPGTFYGADGPDLGTHGAGRIAKLSNAGAGANPDGMLVTYVTDKAGAPSVKGGMNQPPTGLSPSAVDLDLYRTPVPLADGNLIAPHVAVKQSDYNTGTVANPVPVAGYSFRLRSLKPPVIAGGFYTNDITLTAGISINTSYYVGATLVNYSGPAWELDPTEVVARTAPAAPGAPTIHPVTAAQFAAAGVDIPTFQNYLTANNAALSVSFDVTKRDRHDKQQPYNLRVSWSNHQTVGTGTSGEIYDIAWLRFYQADLRRGYALNTATPILGRRVVATPMHDTMSHNLPTAGAPAGSVRIGDDGSVAAILPAGKAMTWDMLANDTAKTSQVKERFWVTFQRGEIRTCTNCHGINTADQANAAAPTNPPAALANLLAFWRSTHPSGTMQFAASFTNALKNAGSVVINVMRTGGSTGPVSVNYATANGTALSGVDFATSTGTLNWADGDTAAKPISVALLNNPVITANKSLSLTLSAPTYGTLGATSAHTVMLTEPLPPPLTLDADGNGQYDALTDGLLIYRYLVGLTGNAHTAGAIGKLPVRSLSTDIALFLDVLRPQLDVDGDTQVLPATDGLIVLRYLLGLRGGALTAGITGVGPRPVGQIETYIQALMP